MTSTGEQVMNSTPLLEWWHYHHPGMFDLQDYEREGVRSLWKGYRHYQDHLYQFCKRIEVIGVCTERDGIVPICQLQLRNGIIAILKRDWGKWSGCVFSKKVIFLKDVDQIAYWNYSPKQKEFLWIPEQYWGAVSITHSNIYEFQVDSDAKVYALFFLLNNVFPALETHRAKSR